AAARADRRAYACRGPGSAGVAGGGAGAAGGGGAFPAGRAARVPAPGVTTIRVTGSQGLAPQEARQAMRYGAFRGPRVLTCGKIISATAPGGRFYGDMYREADGPDDMRRAVRQRIRAGAELIKGLATGAPPS